MTKSIVETEASEVRAELTEDIAADRMATMRKPFSRCGHFGHHEDGKDEVVGVDAEPGAVPGRGILKGMALVKDPQHRADQQEDEEERER